MIRRQVYRRRSKCSASARRACRSGSEFTVAGRCGVLALALLAGPFASASIEPRQALSPQALVNAAAAGSVVTIPAGIYSEGLVISKALTLNLDGVALHATAWGKGVVLIENPDGPVVVNDLRVDGQSAGADQGNLAAVRISGRDFDVTLNRAQLRRSAMGILTDNRGGVLRLNDSVVEDIGWGDKPKQLSHLVYAGLIDRLEVNNSRLVASHNRGHLLKSRARLTLVRDSRLLGLNSQHSRIVDLPCGGQLRVERTHLQRSDQADNLDLLAVGQESGRACKGRELRTELHLSHSLIELGEKGTGLMLRQVFLFNFARPVDTFVVEDNHLVSHGIAWLVHVPRPGVAITSLPDSNNVSMTMEPGFEQRFMASDR